MSRPHRHRLIRRNLVGALLALGAALAHADGQIDEPACSPAPFTKRELFLRGTMNNWGAADDSKFQWTCDHYELVRAVQGEQQFKIGDEDWAPDVDFGGSATALRRKGPALHYRFRGLHRFILTMSTPEPQLRIEDCPAPPLGDTTLYLRGSLNNWGALDDYAFQYHCDAYYLNLNASNRQEFKISDVAWTPAHTFGADAKGQLASGQALVGNLSQWFQGEHTLRLVINAKGEASLAVGPRTFADPKAASVTDPVALSLHFNSRELAQKAPFGAVTAGTEVAFNIEALPGLQQATLVLAKRRLEGNQELLEYKELARLPLQKSAVGTREVWSGRYRFAEPGVYGYHFEVQIDGKPFVYQNNKDPVYWTREKGSMGLGAVEELPDVAQPGAAKVRRYRQTVYAADFKVPDYARDLVYYYIFPERFRNGDKRNDPQPGVARYHDKTVELHKHWLDKPYRPGSGDGSDDVYNNDFAGGDLAGIIEKLDYIKDLGANAIYMTPVFRAASNHKYDTADYKNIDPGFGTNEDFTRLTAEAAKRGIRVIPDTSLNHVGSDSIYFDRFNNFKAGGAFQGGKINPASTYADWFKLDPSQSNPDRQYQGWVDISDLPEINKSSPSFRAYAYGAADSVMKLWLDRGAAGWRMDVAPWVPDDFWREWRAAIKAHRPDAITIAESWFDSSKFFLGDSFDSTMNYIFRSTVLDYAGGGDARKLYANIELMREAYPPQAFYALMNLLSSHDQARALHHLGYHDDGDAAKLAEAKQRLRLAVFFQMCFPGAPTIYYGDEVGLAGGDDPYNRASYPWADEGGQPDTELLADFKRLTRARHDHPVLRHGSIDAPLFLDEHVIVLARQDGSQWAITATNNADSARTVSVKLPPGMHGIATLRDALDSTLSGASPSQDGMLTLSIPAHFGRILISP